MIHLNKKIVGTEKGMKIMNTKSQIIRRYDIDWLRVLAVILLIPFHSMHIFILQPYSVVYIKNQIGISYFELITQFIHEFHMPLLFILAGSSAYLALQVRSVNRYIQERFRRLFIPAVTGIFFLVPPMTYIYKISKGDDLSFFTHFKHFFTNNPGDLSGLTGAFTPAHLWFIIFLFMFSLVGAPLFIILNKHSSLLKKLGNFLTYRFFLLLYTIPIALAASTNILGDKNPLVYFLIFLLGYILMTNEDYQRAINRDKIVYLILGIIFEIILQCYSNNFPAWSLIWISYELMRTANRLLLVFVILGFGNKLLNHPSKILSYLSKSSFSVYILHLPINTFVGYFIVKTNLGLSLKFFLIILLTTLVSFAFYEVIRRIDFLCFLLGIKTGNKLNPNKQVLSN